MFCQKAEHKTSSSLVFPGIHYWQSLTFACTCGGAEVLSLVPTFCFALQISIFYSEQRPGSLPCCFTNAKSCSCRTPITHTGERVSTSHCLTGHHVLGLNKVSSPLRQAEWSCSHLSCGEVGGEERQQWQGKGGLS